mmetsp:Transcript_48644/g.96819  ORF Transcript_48644/g.96819 Transcript_48644/m.96819 type:complete len:218 (+) Transcript_48644:674-1327(+)
MTSRGSGAGSATSSEPLKMSSSRTTWHAMQAACKLLNVTKADRGPSLRVAVSPLDQFLRGSSVSARSLKGVPTAVWAGVPSADAGRKCPPADAGNNCPSLRSVAPVTSRTTVMSACPASQTERAAVRTLSDAASHRSLRSALHNVQSKTPPHPAPFASSEFVEAQLRPLRFSLPMRPVSAGVEGPFVEERPQPTAIEAPSCTSLLSPGISGDERSRW